MPFLYRCYQNMNLEDLKDLIVPAEIAAVIDKAYDKIGTGYSTIGLNEEQRTVVLVVAAQGIIDNGGLSYFFHSDFPDQIPYERFAEAFENIGATEAGDAIRKALSVFSIEHPELDYEHRRITMERLGLYGYDGGFKPLTDKIMGKDVQHSKLLANYINQHGLA